MGYFVRVHRGQFDVALRQLQRMMAVDQKSLSMPKFHEKKSAKKRRVREQRRFHREREELMGNLKTIFERRARGF